MSSIGNVLNNPSPTRPRYMSCITQTSSSYALEHPSVFILHTCLPVHSLSPNGPPNRFWCVLCDGDTGGLLGSGQDLGPGESERPRAGSACLSVAPCHTGSPFWAPVATCLNQDILIWWRLPALSHFTFHVAPTHWCCQPHLERRIGRGGGWGVEWKTWPMFSLTCLLIFMASSSVLPGEEILSWHVLACALPRHCRLHPHTPCLSQRKKVGQWAVHLRQGLFSFHLSLHLVRYWTSAYWTGTTIK